MQKKLFFILILGFSFISAFAQATATNIQTFHPFGAQGVNPSLKVANQVSGYCWSPSVANGRQNTWRCMAGNAVLDPCFSDNAAQEKRLVCVKSPTDTSVTLLQLTKPLPKAKDRNFNIKKTMPWAIELTDGNFCTYMTGGTTVVMNKRMNYGCNNGGYLFGDIARKGHVWQTYFSQQGTKDDMKLVPIKTAWY